MSAQPASFTPDPVAQEAKLAARIVVRRQFNELLLQASQLLQKADQVAALGGLSDIEIQQARAAGKIAGVNLYSLPLCPDPVDFRRLDDDLRHIARSVDPLIEAIGADAKHSSNEIDDATFKECFEDVIERGIDGALHVLDDCGEAARQTLDDRADAIGDHKRKSLQNAE